MTSEQIALVGTHWSKGWIIEDNVISHSVCSGISLGKYGDEWDNKAGQRMRFVLFMAIRRFVMKISSINSVLALGLLSIVFGVAGISSVVQAAPLELLDKCNVVWATPGTNSLDSMPLGNGDIGLNVWVEKDGDLVLYISKTDAWSDDVNGEKGLLKVGRVRVKLDPNPFAGTTNFLQELKLREGVIEIEGGRLLTTDGRLQSEVRVKVWVDANRPVIHVEAGGELPFGMGVQLEPMRPVRAGGLQADTVLDGQTNRVAWYYRNGNPDVAQLKGLTFGGIIEGAGMVVGNARTLKSAQVATRQAVSVHILAAQTATPDEWLARLEKHVAETGFVKLETAYEQHKEWWKGFWARSWVFFSGDEKAGKASQGYTLQRFVSACAGRGAYPIKFNGSIFTMDWATIKKAKGVETVTVRSADARNWGGQYWFQNTRAMYWPMLQSGDFEMMQPLFRMYLGQLAGNTKAVRKYYGHDGAYFAETNPFWGSLSNIKPDAPGSHTVHYFTPILELTAMMLDYFKYTGDQAFVRTTLLPIADAGMLFFDQHWKKENGKLLLDPDNAIEMFWKARNPAPDIAGLRFDLGGLLALPADLTTEEQRQRWKRLLDEIPDMPVDETNGVKVLKAADVHDGGHNMENPELYSIYPFRLFGLGKPDLELARVTFKVRRCPWNGCWQQNGVQAALLGETATAKKNVEMVLTRKDKQVRFPAFWDHACDYVPDEDNGGNGVNAVQLMLMQCEDRAIRLLPAWPKEWTADFKLHAPYQTTVEGRVEGGKIVELKVTPEERRKDVIFGP